MYSDTKIETVLPFFKDTPTKKEMILMQQNYTLLHDNGKLLIPDANKITTATLKENLSNAKTDKERIAILTSIINNLI